jgi:hypothetical protein
VVNFTPRPLYLLGKSPWNPLDRRLGGTQSRSGHGGEEKTSQPLPGFEPPTIQPVVIYIDVEIHCDAPSTRDIVHDTFSRAVQLNTTLPVLNVGTSAQV